MMRYYPVCLDIRNRACLVVGGGQVGTRKVTTLLLCGARVTLVSPEAGEELTELARAGTIQWHARNYESGDQAGAFLVIGATDQEALNRRIHADAEKDGRLCNIADQPKLCNFVLPSIVQQGDLMIAISTGGQSPAFAKYLRRQMQRQFGPEYAHLLKLMGAVRKHLLQQAHAPEEHKPIFERLIAKGLLELIRRDDRATINALLAEVVGPDVSLETLRTR
ncbi:precorrin-2 dehydrogenase/sirohydrochlorin ferrochelatase family protein [Desulfatitalea alkaliphila]|uniref:precorrin-2 dehydrogenase n=1 Tax=Desulfatitalea alkaliphila TaxID=2929485 RepID=A0AA41QZX4_9BACT|nr:bifunctional precorrin-2 dehydrogenase/sirohydrochlorin ferrochelatase [Desulfatitalea alkaliphila]MCJ8499459.1 bifunctional precorrin-2 dehydrogenase/sirohydrochlorin ferrochelatase [Desulfatitalea alkaliphila]